MRSSWLLHGEVSPSSFLTPRGVGGVPGLPVTNALVIPAQPALRTTGFLPGCFYRESHPQCSDLQILSRFQAMLKKNIHRHLFSTVRETLLGGGGR